MQTGFYVSSSLSITFTTNYAYDPATGNLTQTWMGSSNPSTAWDDILYGYTNQGQLESVTQVTLNGSAPASVSGTRYDADGNAIATTSPTTIYTYDPDGNLTQVTDPNGMVTSYQYDSLNQLTGQTVTLNGTNTFTEQTTYYDSGLKEDVVDKRYTSTGSLSSQTTTSWQYDANGHLTQEQLVVNSGSGSSVPTAYTNSYTYDLEGNRLSQMQHTATTNETITYTYDGDNQLTTETGSGSGSAGDYFIGYTYDASGNLASQVNENGNYTIYSYDLRNLMVQALSVATSDQYSYSLTNYTYDTDGVLAAETSDSDQGLGNTPENVPYYTSTSYVNDPNNPTDYDKAFAQTTAIQWYGYSTVDQIVESQDATFKRAYVIGLKIEAQNDYIYSQSGGITSIPFGDEYTGTLYLLTDGHGSTRAVVNSSRQVIQTYDYDAFGDALDFNPNTADTTWLFGGDGFYDAASGFTYQLARWRNGFDFTQSDPSGTFAPGDLGNANLYEYASGNPVNFVDPSGNGSITNALLGTAVHSYLNRAFEGFTSITPGFPNVGGNPGPRRPSGTGPGTTPAAPGMERWSNRWISTIASWYGNAGPANSFRPDFVEVNRPAMTGDLYELKPLSLFDALSGTSASMASDLAFYNGELSTAVPNVAWSLGRTWAPGLTMWPTFKSPLMPPGSELVTIDDYEVMPGAIFYDIVGIDDVAELASAAAAGIAALATVATALSGVEAATEVIEAEAPMLGLEASADIDATVIGSIGLTELAEAA